MAVTITNHLVRSADARHMAGFGDGAGIVIRLPGGVLTGGRAVAIEAAGGGQPDHGRFQPGGVRRRFSSRVDAWAGQFGLTGPLALYTHLRCPGRVMAWTGAGDGVLATGGLRGEEDEQA